MTFGESSHSSKKFECFQHPKLRSGVSYHRMNEHDVRLLGRSRHTQNQKTRLKSITERAWGDTVKRWYTSGRFVAQILLSSLAMRSMTKLVPRLLLKRLRQRSLTLVSLAVCVASSLIWLRESTFLSKGILEKYVAETNQTINRVVSNKHSQPPSISSFQSSLQSKKREIWEQNEDLQSNGYKIMTRPDFRTTSTPVTSRLETKVQQNMAIQHHYLTPLLSRPHPHAGAKDEHGQWGYIHDPTYLKHRPLPFENHICDVAWGNGEETAKGYEGLKLLKVSNASAGCNNEQLLSIPSVCPKIFCVVYTHSNRHDTLLQAIAETYGPNCDGFMAASNLTNRTIGAVNLPHEGPEAYNNMWNKVRSIWGYIHDHFIDDYDYFHIGGDNMYLIPQNLRHFLSTQVPPSSPAFQYFGGIMISRSDNKQTFCGGGAGYTLNQATLRLLVKTLMPVCGLNLTTSQEDVTVGACFLRHNKDFRCNDTRDAQLATRYHQSGVDWQMKWGGGFKNVMGNARLSKVYNFSYLPYEKGLSSSSISFHLTNPNVTYIGRRMRRYHAILFPHSCKSRLSEG